ncbi:SPARC-related modular calcium-binding protein 1 isoform X3 [Trichogramma pretiosum]|uniref:SPARC-related modular calcium-binding protein 1 isoform X3 n=1 Tax=Trichogramma pretiosum TaxID=7493 RepID=UPI000C71A484|nr:SPARC-related modular calcium-binding protein 1 isoform X3 [Trichogramma pretiosum]
MSTSTTTFMKSFEAKPWTIGCSSILFRIEVNTAFQLRWSVMKAQKISSFCNEQTRSLLEGINYCPRWKEQSDNEKNKQAFHESKTHAKKEECRRKIAACSASMEASGSLEEKEEEEEEEGEQQEEIAPALSATAICGSDGVTYPNQCSLASQRCLGLAVTMRHQGPCLDGAEPHRSSSSSSQQRPKAATGAALSPCLQARATSRGASRIACRPDGSYAPVQCHQSTGYCWCVTAQGRPIPDTTVREGRPRCAAWAAKSSETRNGGGRQGRKSPSWKQRRQYNSASRHRSNAVCDRQDKARFNANLIDNFKIEYRRINSSAEGPGEKNVERVLGWKFDSLDKDGDGYLDRAEYKELRRLAKKVVRPKKCARTFARSCDLDRDLKLSRQEWAACLSNDFSHAVDLVAAPQTFWRTQQHKDQVLKVHHPSAVHSRPTFNDDPPDTSDDTDANDCISDRRSVLEDQRTNSQKKFYIPECTPDGRYHKVQCYSGYCWCVYQDTGKPIPGTSSQNQQPNCNPVPAPVRPMKGCPEAKKQLFLRDLMDLMQKKMKASSTDSDEATDNWQASKEERVATWHFVMLDKNKNKMLERKEWKSFRAMVSNSRQLRRCGKKLPRYCDVNNDRRISMTEWLSCLNAQRPVSAGDRPTEKAATSKPRRMGPNPLDQFLNDDD